MSSTDTQERLERLRELTERLVSEQPSVLVEGDAMLVSLASSDSVLVAQVADDDLTIRYASDAACQLFGYSVPEMLGKPISDLMPDRHRNAHKAGIRRYLETGEAHVVGRFIRGPGLHSSGIEIPLVIFIRTGGVSGSPVPATFLATIRDERDAVVLQ